MQVAAILFCAFVMVQSFKQQHLATTSRHGKQQFSFAMNAVASPLADEMQGWSEESETLFLTKYWQKKPLLVRGAFFGSSNRHPRIPTRDELLELAEEDDVESRILVKSSPSSDKWTKEYGPFERSFLSKLAKSKSKVWTVLVQEVDRHVPAVADLWNIFSFIPAWRRDDVMISYATPGGGIGAHVDNYDVFLVQGRGEREWSIENSFVSQEEEKRREVKKVDTRLLRDFVQGQSWILQAGDMLYLPPRVPHRGTSIGGDCTTVSMGFRAPALRSMMTAFVEHVCSQHIAEGVFYSDPDLAEQLSSGNSSSSSNSGNGGGGMVSDARRKISSQMREKLLNVLDDEELFDQWLGMYITEPLRMQMRTHTPFFLGHQVAETEESKIEIAEEQEEDEDDEDELPLSVTSKHRVASSTLFPDAESVLQAALDGTIRLRRAEGIKIVYIDSTIFVNGEAYPLPTSQADAANRIAIAELLSGKREIDTDLLVKALSSDGSDMSSSSSSSSGTRRPSSLVRFLAGFVRSGFFYPVDVQSCCAVLGDRDTANI